MSVYDNHLQSRNGMRDLAIAHGLVGVLGGLLWNFMAGKIMVIMEFGI